jgi:hypothetical protein
VRSGLLPGFLAKVFIFIKLRYNKKAGTAQESRRRIIYG